MCISLYVYLPLFIGSVCLKETRQFALRKTIWVFKSEMPALAAEILNAQKMSCSVLCCGYQIDHVDQKRETLRTSSNCNQEKTVFAIYINLGQYVYFWDRLRMALCFFLMVSPNFENMLRYHKLHELTLFWSFSIFSISKDVTPDKGKEPGS